MEADRYIQLLSKSPVWLQLRVIRTYSGVLRRKLTNDAESASAKILAENIHIGQADLNAQHCATDNSPWVSGQPTRYVFARAAGDSL